VVFLAKEGLAESLFYNTPMLSLGPSAVIRQDLTPYGYYPIVPQYYGFNGRTSYHPTTTIHRLRRDAESDSAFTYSVMAHHPSNDGMVDNRYNAFRMDDRMVRGLTSRMDSKMMNPSLMQDRQRQMMDGRMQHGYQLDNMNNMDRMNMGRMNMDNMNIMNMDNMNMDRMNMDNMNMDRMNMDRMNMDNMNMGRTNMDRTNLNMMDMDNMNMNMMNMDRMSNMDNMNIGRTNLNMMNMDDMNMNRMNMGHQMNRFKREADSDVVRYSTMTETPFQRSQTSVYYEDSPKILMQTPRPMYLTNGYTMPYVTTRPSMITRPVIMTYY